MIGNQFSKYTAIHRDNGHGHRGLSSHHSDVARLEFIAAPSANSVKCVELMSQMYTSVDNGTVGYSASTM